MSAQDHDGGSARTRVLRQIVTAIKEGAGSFTMPWHGNGVARGRPRNARTDALYRGSNVLSLWVAAQTGGYPTPFWATFTQWRALDAHVQKGARGTPILVYLPREARPSNEDVDQDQSPASSRPIARSFVVFNVSQVTGWTPPALPRQDLTDRVARADTVVAGTGAIIEHDPVHAYYAPRLDVIRIPAREAFIGTPTRNPTEAFYGVLLHELTHWTGAAHRFDRPLQHRFGTDAYAMEELVAELGAAFLCADLGITNYPRADHAAYLASWLRVLEADERALFSAATLAAAAADFIMTGNTSAR